MHLIFMSLCQKEQKQKEKKKCEKVDQNPERAAYTKGTSMGNVPRWEKEKICLEQDVSLET